MTQQPTRPDALTGRAAAALAVADVLTGRQFVSEALRSFRMAGRLEPREAGLALEIAQGAVRHLITIEHVLDALARFAPEQTKPRLRAILYTAAYQIIWMDGVPPFAAVDESVELARQLVHGRTPGMVNAVLRRVAGAVAERRTPWQRLDPTQIRASWEAACRFDRPVLPAVTVGPASLPAGPEPLALHLAAAAGERAERMVELMQRFGSEPSEAVAWASQAVPVTVAQRNTLRATPEQFFAALRAALGDAVELADDAAFVPAGAGLFELPAWTAGLLYVQDTSARAAARAVAARPGERILDLCAAPGGKSITLALGLENRGAVVACDVDAERLQRVRDNAARLGLDCIHTRPLSGTEADFAGAPPFDAALVDAPCSNTGVIARRPEARLGLTPRKLRSLVELQQRLLARAAGLVRAAGRLVYSTCSIEPWENERVVTDFLDEHGAWELEAQELTLPAWGARPHAWRDGGYWARLVRRA
ncbi:MAG: transcription antitermination factor NusB [Planctomycetota bacterium]